MASRGRRSKNEAACVNGMQTTVKLTGDPAKTFRNPRDVVKKLLELLCGDLQEQPSHVKAMAAEAASKILLKFFKSQLGERRQRLDDEKQAIMDSVLTVEKLMNANKLESTLRY